MTLPTALSPLWLTSRSPIERGQTHCPYARYVEYHAGPLGYGFQRRAQSLPLVTGTYIHAALAAILQWVLDARRQTNSQPDQVPDEVVRWATELALEKYRAVVEKRGILSLSADDPDAAARLARLIKEQECLVEGLIWQWSLQRLPAYLGEYLLISVEEEETYVLDCTCGVGTGIGEIADHESRGCAGIGLQSRPDFLGQRHSDGHYAYSEFKTTAVAKKAWNDSWERKQQFLMGVVGAERRHGVEITHAWVEGLIKGQRKREYPYTDDLPKQQQTCLCYPYFSPGAPPVSVGEWRPSYNYRTAEGLEFTAGKKEGYRKTALWDISADQGFPGKPEEMSVGEYWSRVLVNEYPYHAEKCVSLIGPIPKQRHMIDKALRSVVTEERLWQDRLWKIYEFNQQTGKEWGDPEFMEFVEGVIPRSWNCDPWGPDHPCPNIPICHDTNDEWRRPVESELFVYRVPHHTPEKEQAIARGLAPEGAEGWADDEVEIEGDD